MSSELSGSHSQVDQPHEGDALGREDRDITHVPAYAGRREGGISRDDAYGQSAAPIAGTDAEGDGAGPDNRHASQEGATNKGNDAASAEAGRDTAGVQRPGSGNRQADVGNDTEGVQPVPATRSVGSEGSRDQAVGATEASAELGRPESRSHDDVSGTLGRGADRDEVSQDTGTTGFWDQSDEEDSPKRFRTGADATQPNSRDGESTDGKSAQGEGGDTQAREQEDQSSERKPSSDANVGKPREAGADHSLDQNSDEQRWAAMEQRVQAAMEQRLNAAIDGIRADYEAKLDSIQEKHEAEAEEFRDNNAQLKQEISELKSELETLRAERQPSPDLSPDSGEQPEPPGTGDAITQGERRERVGDEEGNEADHAGTGVVDKRMTTESAREPAPVPERPGFSAESIEAGKATLGLVGTLGILPPGLDLVLGGDSARRAIEKMSPEEQDAAMRLADTAVTALGSMPPMAATAAIAASMFGPAVHAKAQDIYHKFRRRD